MSGPPVAGVTLTVAAGAGEAQLVPLHTVTEKFVVAEGVTVKDCALAPVRDTAPGLSTHVVLALVPVHDAVSVVL